MEYLNGVPLKIIKGQIEYFINMVRHSDARTFIYFELCRSPIVTDRFSSRIGRHLNENVQRVKRDMFAADTYYYITTFWFSFS